VVEAKPTIAAPAVVLQSAHRSLAAERKRMVGSRQRVSARSKVMPNGSQRCTYPFRQRGVVCLTAARASSPSGEGRRNFASSSVSASAISSVGGSS
jgi:hypothetical protein